MNIYSTKCLLPLIDVAHNAFLEMLENTTTINHHAMILHHGGEPKAHEDFVNTNTALLPLVGGT